MYYKSYSIYFKGEIKWKMKLFLFNFMFFEVNNEVETRREEPGYEVGQNLDSCYFLTIFEIY